MRDCLHIDWVWIKYADDLSNNFPTIVAIGEDDRADMLGGNKEGLGVCSVVSPGVVDNGDPVVNDDLPAESHTC